MILAWPVYAAPDIGLFDIAVNDVRTVQSGKRGETIADYSNGNPHFESWLLATGRYDDSREKFPEFVADTTSYPRQQAWHQQLAQMTMTNYFKLGASICQQRTDLI